MDDTTQPEPVDEARDADETAEPTAPTDEDREAPEPEREPDVVDEVPLADQLQDPAGVGTELTHDQFDLGRSSRIN